MTKTHNPMPGPMPGPIPGQVRALSGPGLVVVYLALVPAPLAMAWGAAPSGGGFFSELATGLALAGYAMLLVQFLLTGRFRLIGGCIGIDVVMRLHQLAARVLTVMIVLHPFLYGAARAWTDPAAYVEGVWRLFSMAPFATGVAAWALLLALVIVSLARNRLPITYEAWRVSHGVMALAVAVLALDHALRVGGFSAAPGLRLLWLILTALAVGPLVHVYVFRPFTQLRHPWRVAAVRRLGPARWLVSLETAEKSESVDGHFAFHAGQFVWLKIGASPLVIHENPFSIVSAPGAARVEFLIREAGDFTSNVGALEPGTRAWIDGPYGAFTLAAASASARHIVLLAGGVGLAPCLAMLREAAARGDDRAFHLVYGNRTEAQVVLRDEIDALASRLNLKIDYVLSEPPPDWAGRHGQLDAATLSPLLSAGEAGADETAYLLCGPPPMVGAAERALAVLGVPPSRIVAERFDYD
jgi:predicted ferric reductase